MDREKVIKGIQECDLNGGLIGNCPYKGILALLKESEAVVRCKDCKHGSDYEDCAIECEFTGFKYDYDWFCADGERK